MGIDWMLCIGMERSLNSYLFIGQHYLVTHAAFTKECQWKREVL